MVMVQDVLHLGLPIAAKLVLVGAAGDLDSPLGRTVTNGVDTPGHGLRQRERRRLRIERGEDEATVARHVRRGDKAELFAVEVVGLAVALAHGHRMQAAIGVEGPAVIGAAKALAGIALLHVANDGAAMAAAVVQHAHLAIGMAHADDRLAPNESGEEVPRLRDLAIVADIDPGPLEDALHLQLEHLGVDEDPPVYPVVQNEITDGGDVSHGDLRPPFSSSPARPSSPWPRAPS